MLKTIKKKKEVRIDELIDYITMNAHKLLNGKEFYTFKSKHGNDVTIDAKGNVNFSYMLYLNDDLYTVEIEEEITEDTEFDVLYVMTDYKRVYAMHNIKTVKEVKECLDFIGELESLHQIYAMVDGKLELIWESEEE